MVTNLPILYLQLKNVITYLAVIISSFYFYFKVQGIPYSLFKNKQCFRFEPPISCNSYSKFTGLQFEDREILFTWIISLACHKKSYLICVEFVNFWNITSYFFQRTKLKQPNGQRQLLENKQILRNNSEIRDFVTCQIAFLMRYFKHKTDSIWIINFLSGM